MAGVLDRLRTFTGGVLELCDPTTPTWAQARLSELLADAGVAPIPCHGQPHPDFHDVIGSLKTADVPAGHISEVATPGFALRGDRGDLFPLRKAQVRVNGYAPEEPADAPTPAPAPAPVAEAEPVEIPIAAVAPVAAVEAAAPEAPPAEQFDQVDEAAAPQEGTPDPKARPSVADAGDARPPRDQRRVDLRKGAREPAGDAPPLPLVPQHADELAARPKSLGFQPLGLNDQILADLVDINYLQPTPIQVEAIPLVLAGRDVVGQAQTGTGKTAAFVLPLLNRLYQIEGDGPVGLIMCPTRELARQVHDEFVRMAGKSAARAALIYGGVPMEDQFRALDRKPHVIIGTPGRIIDHMRRRSLDLSRLKLAVLDEADQMLDIGFWPDVQWIISHTPPARQMLLFSATFPEPVKQMAERQMKEPAHVRIRPQTVTVDQVDQKYIAVAREKKNELLAHFIATFNPPQLLVFCRTKHQTDRVAEVLKRKHMSAGAIHGDLPQSKRERTLAQFRAGELQCLIATNVAARGIDIPTVSHVVNYDIPEMPEEYVHRIGRTARNGAKGVARTFITPDDGQFLSEIEKHIGLLLEEEQIEGFSDAPIEAPKRVLAESQPGTVRLLKPLIGGIRLGRRR